MNVLATKNKKVVMLQQLNNAYRLDQAITKTQKNVLEAFRLNEADIHHQIPVKSVKFL